MPNDPSPDQASPVTDIYRNDPYRNRRANYKSKYFKLSSCFWTEKGQRLTFFLLLSFKDSITWQCPSATTVQSYLPYSDQSSQQSGLHGTSQLGQASTSSHPPSQPAPTMITLSDNSQSLGTMTRDIRQDSLLTTITTTANTNRSPFLHSAVTTLSLSEELRKQKKHQHGETGWWNQWPYLILFYPCCCGNGRRPSWRWLLFMLCCILFCVGGIVLFICLPRLPKVTMAPMADTFGQEPADWGPPQHPFYRTTWQLNLTFDNQPNFIPLHLVQMDLVLALHPSFWNTSSVIASDGRNTTTALATANEEEMEQPFAWATLPDMTLNVDGQHQAVNAIFHIDYVASTSNLTDPTFAQLYNACGPKNINNPPALNVSLHITFHILHYLWLPTMVVYPAEENDGLICPSNWHSVVTF